ncbi:MAG: DEAD/DEAH box helicase, partial [Planctomycetota bacterium]|nr:DEAD/DEAH box helicase [Planctomycetota bacterium]
MPTERSKRGRGQSPADELQSSSQAAKLADLPALVARQPGFAEVIAALGRGESGTIDGAWGSSNAAAVAALARTLDRPLLIVLPRLASVDDVAADLATFLEEAEGSHPLGLAIVPAWESPPTHSSPSDPILGRRLRVLEELESNTPPRLIVASLAALMQPVPSKAARDDAVRSVRVGDELEPEEFMRWLMSRSFERVAAIDRPGEFSMHGGILDLWSADATEPYRIEFFGDEIESIRRFDPETQRKVEELKEVRLLVVGERTGNGEQGTEGRENGRTEKRGSLLTSRFSVLDSLSAETAVVLVEPTEIVDEGRHYLSRLDETAGLFSVEEVLAKLTERPSVAVTSLGVDSYETTCRLHVESVERFSGPKQALAELAAALGRDERVLLACHNEGERERLRELIDDFVPTNENGRNGKPTDHSTLDSQLSTRISLCLGRITKGFRLVREHLIVLSDHELFGRIDVPRKTRKPRHESRAIETFLDLNEGDLVVHLVNGVGRFRGMKLLEKGEQKEEHLELEFADSLRVFVPVSLIHLVQKYVGATKAAPTLSKLGTTTWANKKRRVAEAVQDLASDMLRLHAAREAKPGIAFPPDSHYVEEFDAAFPYEETPDQGTAIAAVKDDMLRPRPMDRLICGDVGYGKTEVAMRAAFKAVDAGKQVAILVPTTVLAEQHDRSFSARMAEFPVVIASLSRFRTKGEQKKIVDKLARGEVDVVVGTHRLVQQDVSFKDLGLLVIDEEQRFGVDVK